MIINDNAFGMIKWKQSGAGFPDYGLDVTNPDFVKYAEAYGAKGYRVNAAEELLPLLKKTLNDANGGVHVIEVPVDYRENSRVFTEHVQSLAEN